MSALGQNRKSVIYGRNVGKITSRARSRFEARSGMLGWPPKDTFEGDLEMAMLPLRVQ
jgi:hypothetical protein